MEQREKFDFITQKVKDRPLNKRKLIRKTIITASMAVIFGLIASITFLMLQPIINNWLHPREEIEQIEIPVVEEEILPEEMVEHEEQMMEPSQEVIDSLKNEIQLEVEDYQELYRRIYDITKEIQSAMVTVSGVSEQIDWFNDPYELGADSIGFVFAQNNAEILILVPTHVISGEEKIEVTFFDGKKVAAYLKGTDYNTQLAVVAVSKEALTDSNKENLSFLNLGSSKKDTLLASPVIALGSPLGKASVVYGMITSVGNSYSMSDVNYEILTTDIYGSSKAEGILVDYEGRVIGVIYQKENDAGSQNLISAIGITELKSALQRMANGLPNTYIGIKGREVPVEIHESKKIPLGVYVTGITMDSPAMTAGIQSGDIVVQIGRNSITTMTDYQQIMEESTPGEVKEMTIMRQSPEGYKDVRIEITIGELN